jgi:hypothetical protein
MISVSDCQLRIVAATADLLPVEARGTFLQRVTAELRGRRDFSDCDVEQAVRAALLDQSAARSPGGQGCGTRRQSDLPSGATRRPPRTMPRAGPRKAC